MKYDHIYNSDLGRKKFPLASGYISETRILFEKEQVLAVIQAAGSVALLDLNGNTLTSGKAAAEIGGREVYEDVFCQVTETGILLQFPIYQWIDNYPHCDGEHDRWDSKIIGCHDLTLNLSTGELM